MIKGILIFTAGAALGSFTTWQFLKDKYERRVQEEIKSVQETWERRHSEPSEPERPVVNDAKEKALAAREKPDIMEYAAKLQSEGYVNYSEMSKPSEEEAPKTTKADTDENDISEKEETAVDKPYIITPEEFGEIDEYDQISLTYFADGVLADEDDEPVEDVENTVGADSVNHFGEYEDDSVFVRNDRLKADFEILKDYREYSDVVRRTGR